MKRGILMSSRRSAFGLLVGMFFGVMLSLGGTALAQKPNAPPNKPAEPVAVAPSVTPASTHDLTTEDVNAFFDGLMPAYIQKEDIGGAVISIVKDGKVLFAKGYGFADVEKRKPVSPSDTLFRPGSISKTFTWTAVMQLVEQGKIDLDRDVNDYLDFKIPPAFGKPITMRNIMTHTSGFEETAKELFVPTAKEMRPLDQYLREHTPERIFPPGTVPAYSNYATAVAGYIVQRISGKPFEQYIADNIFNPLGMSHTTFVQPLPANLQPLMSNGYVLASQPAKSFEFVQAFPAGSVSTSGLDMCTYMMAHLQNGQFGSAQILKPDTAKLMHARQWAYDDRLDAMALGFYEESKNGHRIIGHGGDTAYFHSDMHLILDQNVGFFISFNSAGKPEAGLGRVDIFGKFMDRYFPFTPPPGEKVENSKDHVQQVSGLYMSSRRPEGSFLRVLEFPGQLKVVPNADGTVSIDLLKDPNGEAKKYEEIKPFLFREVHGQLHLAFKPDANGKMAMSIDWPFFIFQRPGFLDNKYLNMALIIPSLVVMALTLLLWPVAAGIRKHYAHPLQLSPQQKRMRLLVRLVCVIDVALVLGWVILASKSDDPGAINRTLDTWIILLMILGVIGALGTLIALLNAVRNWGDKQLWRWTRIHDLVLAIACVAFTWFIWHWNMINFNLRY
jgi:CubicO group peptidase (beta-lactamase class C family)